MAERPEDLEVITTRSPLLSLNVIERDYTKGIGDQVEPPAEPPGEKPVEDYDVGDDTTRGFQFDKKEPEAKPGEDTEAPPGKEPGAGERKDDDTIEIEQEGFKIPEASAKAFASWMGDMIDIYVPVLTFEGVKVDLKNIRWHISEGNLQPHMEDVFQNVNEKTYESLKYSDDEIRMFKKSAKAWLEYENVSMANPRTAFIATCVMLAGKQFYVYRQLSRENRQLVMDAIKLTNPNFVDNYMDEQRARDNVEKETKDNKDAEE